MHIGHETDPIKTLNLWIADARATGVIKDPNAITVVSVSPAGQPHARVVLCKDAAPDGLVFYTNYESQKGREFEQNSKACALFFWDALFRQVKVEGVIERTSRADSEAYWRSRARASQLSQFISRQSAELASRAELERAWREADQKYAATEIPCPPHWGGLRLIPRRFEFWVGMADRLHDRHEFSKTGAGWTHRMLYP